MRLQSRGKRVEDDKQKPTVLLFLGPAMDAAAHCIFKAAFEGISPIRRWRCYDSELSSLPEVTGISSVGSISNAALLKLELLQQPREVQWQLLSAASKDKRWLRTRSSCFRMLTSSFSTMTVSPHPSWPWTHCVAAVTWTPDPPAFTGQAPWPQGSILHSTTMTTRPCYHTLQTILFLLLHVWW